MTHAPLKTMSRVSVNVPGITDDPWFVLAEWKRTRGGSG